MAVGKNILSEHLSALRIWYCDLLMKSKNITFYVNALSKQIRRSCLKMLLVENENDFVLFTSTKWKQVLFASVTNKSFFAKSKTTIAKTTDEQTQIFSGAINLKKSMYSLGTSSPLTSWEAYICTSFLTRCQIQSHCNKYLFSEQTIIGRKADVKLKHSPSLKTWELKAKFSRGRKLGIFVLPVNYLRGFTMLTVGSLEGVPLERI